VSPPAATVFLQTTNFIDAAYIVAFGLMIYGMSGLTGPRTAVRGNQIAATGMAVAVVATLLRRGEFHGSGTVWLIIAGVAIGAAIGVPAARTVKMTAMPQMVALFNGVGGGAVALIAWVEYRHAFAHGATPALMHLTPHRGFLSLRLTESRWPLRVEIFELFGAIVGSISFWGSNIAFGKLQEILPGRPIKLPGAAQSMLNLVLALVAIGSAVVLCAGTHSELLFIVGILVCAGVLGNLLVLPIGGADMPVVISLLNAFTGLSAAATGVALSNPVMIVAGMIVGASGTILTDQMAKAMNRSVPSIIAGGFGGAVQAPAGAAGAGAGGTVRATTAADVAIQLSYARQVVVAPGYGMAVAQAQHAVRELERALEAKGVTVKYAIHPVAGRMPGHMNVLLAEADVPYDLLREMDDINPEFSRTDVTLIIGANDVTNPAAKNEPGSPIYGMPILEVDRSAAVIVLKRSMASGFAGIDNPLFYDPKTSMLFGDAKASVSDITAEVQAL
jgi:proton-translocating NAD(P)+ transhydrogenase subunit beta